MAATGSSTLNKLSTIGICVARLVSRVSPISAIPRTACADHSREKVELKREYVDGTCGECASRCVDDNRTDIYPYYDPG
jgi:hypothetical protein